MPAETIRGLRVVGRYPKPGRLPLPGTGKGSEGDGSLSAIASASLGTTVTDGFPLRPSSAWKPTRTSSQARAQIAWI
jgi:hypothetical protein